MCMYAFIPKTVEVLFGAGAAVVGVTLGLFWELDLWLVLSSSLIALDFRAYQMLKNEQ